MESDSEVAAHNCQVARRAPEIFLGQDAYTEAIDMWAVGCIFGELLRNEPLFPGRSEAEMLERMVRLLGSPNETIWPVSYKPPRDIITETLQLEAGVPKSEHLACELPAPPEPCDETSRSPQKRPSGL